MVREVRDREAAAGGVAPGRGDEAAEVRPPESVADEDRVKSRLLDALLDEHVLLREALRREIDVSRYEIDAFLRDVRAAEADRPAGRDARERVERLLRIHKLQEEMLRALPAMTTEEGLAYLAEHPELSRGQQAMARDHRDASTAVRFARWLSRRMQVEGWQAPLATIVEVPTATSAADLRAGGAA